MNINCCIYCGGPLKKIGKGEHVIPRSLAGTVAVRCVCSDCNNQFSVIDKELISNSPIAIVAAKELPDKPFYVWDYTGEDDLATECKLVGVEPFTLPQVILTVPRPQFRADMEEIRKLNFRDQFRKFCWLLKRARENIADQDKRAPKWIWEKVRALPYRGSFPPRIFTKTSLVGLRNDSTFICRYANGDTQSKILAILDDWHPLDGKTKFSVTMGSLHPEKRFQFNTRDIMRCFAKIAFNLLAYVSENNTPYAPEFDYLRDFVLMDKGAGPSISESGFVVNDDLTTLGCPPKCHFLRLVYYRGIWNLTAALFGSRIGFQISFKGGNQEPFNTFEVTMPINGGDIKCRKSSIVIMHERMRVVWGDYEKILPSVKMINVKTKLIRRSR